MGRILERERDKYPLRTVEGEIHVVKQKGESFEETERRERRKCESRKLLLHTVQKCL